MAAHEFTLRGDAERAKQTAIEAFESRGFAFTWIDAWTGRATKGSKGANIMLGALAQYFELEVSVRSVDAEQSVVRIGTLSSGWMGGAIGASRTKKNFVSLRDELGATFDAAGVLVAHREAG